MKIFARFLFAGCMLFVSAPAWAGFDLYGVVTQMRISPDGNLWFTISPNPGMPAVTTFCTPSWSNMGMLVPAANPQYAYYYGLVLASLTKGKSIGLPNISVFNGTTNCDVTQTGYGIVLSQ